MTFEKEGYLTKAKEKKNVAPRKRPPTKKAQMNLAGGANGGKPLTGHSPWVGKKEGSIKTMTIKRKKRTRKGDTEQLNKEEQWEKTTSSQDKIRAGKSGQPWGVRRGLRRSLFLHHDTGFRS